MRALTTMQPVSYSVSETIPLTRAADVAIVQVRAGAFVRAAGLDVDEQWRVAIATSEAATNAIKFGAPASVVFRKIASPYLGIEVEVSDSGPGFDDVDQVLRRATLDEAVPWHPARRGLGLGLGAIRRLMDELFVGNRERGGGCVVMRKWKRGKTYALGSW